MFLISAQSFLALLVLAGFVDEFSFGLQSTWPMDFFLVEYNDCGSVEFLDSDQS